jgi:hypothetical protein
MIERDLVFHCNFEVGETALNAINLANSKPRDAGEGDLWERSKDILPLFGDFVGKFIVDDAVIGFTNPEELTPVNHKRFDHQFGIEIQGSAHDWTFTLFEVQEGSNTWKVFYILGATDILRYTISESGSTTSME